MCDNNSNNCNQNVIVYDFFNSITSEDGVIYNKGLKGEKGCIGLKGESGCIGPMGHPGCKGEKGEIGNTGCKGEKGEAGSNLQITESVVLDEDKISELSQDPYQFINNRGEKIAKLYAISNDNREDKQEPSSLSGNMSGRIISFDGAFFIDLGPIISSSNSDDNSSNTSRNFTRNISTSSAQKGEKGEPGQRGPEGIHGAIGQQGIQGIQGEQGIQGVQGVRGLTGPAGLNGPKGIKGDTGEKGIPGSQGEKGNSGDNIWYESWDLNSNKESIEYIPLQDNYIYFQGFWNNTSGQYKRLKFRIYNGNKTPPAGFLGGSKWTVGIYDNGSDETLNTTGLFPWDSNNGGSPNPWPRNRIAQGSQTATISGLIDNYWLDVELDNEGVYLDRNKVYFIAIKKSVDPNMSASTWFTSLYGIDKNTTKGVNYNSLSWEREDNFDNNSSNWESLPFTSYGPDIVGGEIVSYHPPVQNIKSLWFIIYGEQYAEGAIRGPKGEKGQSGIKGIDGSFGENLWYESWNMTFEKIDEDIDIINNSVYFQGFWNKTSGDYTNLKIRVNNNTITPNSSGIKFLINSKFMVAIYDNGAQNAIDNHDINSGFSSWNRTSTGGISEPWPNNKLGEGIFGPGSLHNPDSLDETMSKDNIWVDIKFQQPIRLYRNKIYFVAIKQAVDPNMMANSWQTQLYGIKDSSNQLHINMTYKRDDDGFMRWDEMPSRSFFNETFNGNVVNSYTPQKTNSSIWFIVYGNQYADGALKGDKGEDGKVIIESGAGSLWHESWNINDERENNYIDLSNNYVYYQAFWNKTTGFYKNIKFRIGQSQRTNLGNASAITGLAGSKWIVGIYDNGSQDVLDGTSNSLGLPPWNQSQSAINQPWPDCKIAEGSINAAIIGEIDNNFIDIPLDESVLLKRNKVYFIAIKQAFDFSLRQSVQWNASIYGSNDQNNSESWLTWERDNSFGNNDASYWNILPDKSYATELIPDNTSTLHSPSKNNKSIWFILYGDQYAEGVEIGPKGLKGNKGCKGDVGFLGPKGSKGPQGIPGTASFKGDKGNKGESGDGKPDGYYMHPTDTTNVNGIDTPNIYSVGEFKQIYFDTSGSPNGPYLIFQCVNEDSNGNLTSKHFRVKVDEIVDTSNSLETPDFNY
tara:strand:- start:4689 stop:8099 length:3411 start_codon:yes stop_codon:yes gene_type:complete